MVFHWSQSDNKAPQESRTLLSILADLRNSAVWMDLSMSFDLQLFQSSYPASRDHSECTSYNWYHHPFHVQ